MTKNFDHYINFLVYGGRFPTHFQSGSEIDSLNGWLLSHRSGRESVDCPCCRVLAARRLNEALIKKLAPSNRGTDRVPSLVHYVFELDDIKEWLVSRLKVYSNDQKSA